MLRLGKRRLKKSSCDCGQAHGALTCDAVLEQRANSDPTGTLPLRRALARELDARWTAVRRAISAQVGAADILALSPETATTQLFSMGASRLTTAQTWIDNVLAQHVTGIDGGEWLAEGARRAYADGVARAASRLRRPLSVDYEASTVYGAAAVVELEGVMEAVSQQALRALGAAMRERASPRAAARAMIAVVDKVGALRGRAVVSVEVVRAYSGGTLDALEGAGVERVGLVPEWVASPPQAQDVRPKTRRPSAYRRSKIERAERKLSELERVNVLTAGDYKVCEVCEDIAEGGPFEIDEARGLIPSHPNCRCAFEPIED